MIPYQLSRDYTLLKQLLDEGKEVVCFADYRWSDGKRLRDVCRARCHVEDKFYDVSSRGQEYASWFGWYSKNRPDFTFEKAMEKANIEFIPPTL